MTNYYQILGLPENSEINKIKQEYRRLARIYHPDSISKNAKPDKDHFNEIQVAYEVLSDPKTKAEYDTHIHLHKEEKTVFSNFMFQINAKSNILFQIMLEFIKLKIGNQTEDFFTFLKNDFPKLCKKYDINNFYFADLINTIFRERQEINPSKEIKLNIHATIRVKLEDIYAQNTKRFTIKRYRKCTSCCGKGFTVVCSKCKKDCSMKVICSDCFSWELTNNDCKRCADCKYKGCYIDSKEFLIPLFQNKLTFEGEGDEINNQFGDVVFTIQPKVHEFFNVHKNHLVIEKKISLYEWLYGINFRFRHLNGQIIRVFQNKHLKYPVYRMKGLGMPPNDTYEEHGDLLISLQLDFTTIDRELMYKLTPPININDKFKPEDNMITELHNNLEPVITEEMDSLHLVKQDSSEATKSIEIKMKKTKKKQVSV